MLALSTSAEVNSGLSTGLEMGPVDTESLAAMMNGPSICYFNPSLRENFGNVDERIKGYEDRNCCL